MIAGDEEQPSPMTRERYGEDLIWHACTLQQQGVLLLTVFIPFSLRA